MSGQNLSERIVDENSSLTQNIFSLAIPTILEELSKIASQYVNTAMVGGLGAFATAAVGVNASTVVLLWGILIAIGMGFSVIVATSIGEGSSEKAERTTRQAMLVAAVVGLVMSILMITVGRYTPLWLGASPEVAPSAMNYIQIIGAAAFFQSLSTVASGLLRGVGNTKVPMIINLTVNAFAIVGNIFLIPGSWEFEISGVRMTVPGANLGVEGAAIATAGSIVLSGIVMVLYLLYARTPVKLLISKSFRPDKQILREVSTLGLPILFERVSLALGQIVLTAMVAGLGTTAVASHYIVNSISTLIYEVSIGFSYASTTLVAQSYGAKNMRLCKRYTKLCMIIGVLLSAFLSAIVFALADSLARIFTIDLGVAALVVVISRMDACSEPFFAASNVLCGVFRGYGDTKFPFVVSFVGIIITRIFFGWLFGYALAFGIIGIWMGILVDIIVRAVMCILHLSRSTKVQGNRTFKTLFPASKS